MATANNAFISLDQIVASTLIRHNKPIHFYLPYLKLAADAVRELQLSAMPLLQHTILTKETSGQWFHLPDEFTDWVEVGVRIGERWRPVGVSNRLLPYPKTGTGGEFNPEYNSEYYKGEWTSWLQSAYRTTYGDYSGTDFFFEDYLTDDESSDSSGYGGSCADSCVRGNPYRKDVVTFNPQLGVIMVPKHFPCNSLYLTYVAIGQVDTMTHIPVQAQSTIEAYIDWKYEANKRGAQRGVLADLERLYYVEYRKMIARLDPITMTDIGRIMDRYYGQQNYYSTYYNSCEDSIFGSCSSTCQTIVSPDGINSFTIVISDTNMIYNQDTGTYTVTDPRLKDKTLSYIITEAQYYNSAFWTKGLGNEFFQSTILSFYNGQTITLVVE